MTKEKLYQARVKTPTMVQMEATECGAISLAILLAYYQKFITPEDARIACSVSRDGTKAINIVKAARNYGMEAGGANLEIEELDCVDVPFIVYWEFNHFLIVEGYNSKRVYLNDPATGPRTVSWEEFEKGYTGVVLEIIPGDEFIADGKPTVSTFKLLLNKLGHNWLPLFFIIITTLALIIPKIATPIFVKSFIDYLLIDNQKSLIPIVLFGLGFTAIAETVLTWFQQKFLRKLQVKLDLTNAVNFLWHLFHLPIRYFQQRATGDIVHRNSLNEKVAAILAHDLPGNIVGILEMIAFAAVIVYLSWQLSLVLLMVVVINVIVLYRSKSFLSDLGLRYSQDRGKLDGIETNGIQIIETLKVSGLENHFFNRWAAYHTKFLNTEHKIIWTIALLGMVPQLLSLWTNISIICYGSYLVMTGFITIGTIIAIQALMSDFLKPMEGLFGFFNRLIELKGDIVRLDDVVQTSVDPLFLPGKIENEIPKSTAERPLLQVKNLNFSYSPLDPPTLSDITLELFPGERIAIVGPSGSGKSSLARLICGLDRPNAGEIYYNGILSTEVSAKALSHFLGYVNQNIVFFPGTLRDNLTLWDHNIDDEQIFSALRKVNFYDAVIERGGLSALINEAGSNFSGGQCQRLEIARALIRNPRLLILDEATSAMDAKLEVDVYQSLLATNHTLLIIAHRLSAIRECDKIYVIDQGQIIQQGPHEVLIREEGLYRELVSMEATS